MERPEVQEKSVSLLWNDEETQREEQRRIEKGRKVGQGGLGAFHALGSPTVLVIMERNACSSLLLCCRNILAMVARVIQS